MSTSLQIEANRQNAQVSTGPTTEAGKAVSSRNALTTGLTGREVLLPSDNRQHYDAHLAAYRDQFRPANLYETTLVQAIADCDWRLLRIPILMLSLEALGTTEVAEKRAKQNLPADPATLSIEAFRLYEKSIRNLYLQESRLHRRREQELAQLKAVQAERRATEAVRLDEAAELYTLAQASNEPFVPAEFGFEFSTDQIKAHLARRRTASSLHAPSRRALPAVA